MTKSTNRQDQPTPGRPCFSRTEAPIGVYNGEHAIIVYDLRPRPLVAEILDPGAGQPLPSPTQSGTEGRHFGG